MGLGCSMWSLPKTCVCAVNCLPALSPLPELSVKDAPELPGPCHRGLLDLSIQADQLLEMWDRTDMAR